MDTYRGGGHRLEGFHLGRGWAGVGGRPSCQSVWEGE